MGSGDAFLFVQHCCRWLKLSEPEIVLKRIDDMEHIWEASLLTQGTRIGAAAHESRWFANASSYLDAARYLDSLDPSIWEHFSRLNPELRRSILQLEKPIYSHIEADTASSLDG